MSHTLTSLEFLFTNGGIEVHTHAGPSVLASCVCTSRLNRGVKEMFFYLNGFFKHWVIFIINIMICIEILFFLFQ